MIDPTILVVIGVAAYALWQGTGGTPVTGPGTQATLGPGTRPAAPGTQPSGGGGGAEAGPGAAAAGAALPLIRQAAGQIRPGSVPTPPSSVTSLSGDPLSVAADIGMSAAEFGAMAGQLGIAPEALAGALSDAAAGLGTDVVGMGVVEGAEIVGGQFASVVGWALPIAAAVAIGAMILKSALSRRGSFGESKDRARASVARLGMPEAFRIANLVLDSLLATGRPPAAFTRDAALQTGYVFANWYDNVDSFHDAFQNQPGGLEAAEILRMKAEDFYTRVEAVSLWRVDLLNFVQQADESWGRSAAPQFYIEEIGRRVPPPAWFRAWHDFREFAALGYAGMLAYLRGQVAWETVGRWAGEGGNA